MPRAKIIVQLFLDGRAAWRVEEEIDRKFARRMTQDELNEVGNRAVENISEIVGASEQKVVKALDNALPIPSVPKRRK